MKYYFNINFLIKLIGLFLMLFSLNGICETTYKIGVEELDYLPYAMGKHNTYIGYARDLLDAFADKYGYKFEYVVLPIQRLNMTYFDAKTLDFKFPDNPNWVVELRYGENIYYSNVAIDEIEGLLVLSEHKGKGIDKIKTIGMPRGFNTPFPYKDKIKSGSILLYQNSDFEGLINQLLIGRVDAVYAGVDAGLNIVNVKLNLNNRVTFDSKLPYMHMNYTLSTMRHPNIIKQFNEFLSKEKALQNSLRKKYGMITMDKL